MSDSSDDDPRRSHARRFTISKLQQMHDPVPYTESVQHDEIPHAPRFSRPGKKVTIVGCGQVGLAIAFALVNQEAASSIALIDMNGEKLEGEVKDLRQGAAFHRRVRVDGSTEYDVSANSHLVIVTAGAARRPGMTRLDLVKKNVSVMKSIIPKVLAKSPDAAICIVSNPCDVMTAVAAKLAGPSVPPGRIFGSGTCLDSSRLRSLIAKTLDIDTLSVHGYIIGEHGDSSVPVWTSVRVGGVPFLKHGEAPGESHAKMHKEVVETAADVIKRKGYTNWAIGLAVAHISVAVLNNQHSVMPVSTCVRGYSGVEKDVFLSLPCVVGSEGVIRVIDLPLSQNEGELLLSSSEKVWDVQKDIWELL